MMLIREGFEGAVGNTPLIELRSLSRATGCRVLGKAENLSPGGSVKDRAALGIVLAAEASGALSAGGLIVEGTAGNTGIGLAHVALARGYRCSIVIPKTMSEEKIETLRVLRADVLLVPEAPFAEPGNYYHVARRRAEELGGFWANQFENTANADIHERTTGPELLADTGGRLDGFVCAAGTGGTIGGTTAALKAARPDHSCWLVDCEGSALHAYVTTGVLTAQGSSILEGIGIRRITANFARAKLDGAFTCTDREAVEMAHLLLREDGFHLGGSAALNCVGAVKLARKLGPGKTIATILCDGGMRYQSRLYNEEWLRTKNLVPTARDLSFIEA